MGHVKRSLLIKAKIVEFLKYDLGWLAVFPATLGMLIGTLLFWGGRYSLGFKIISTCFRQGWPGTILYASYFVSKQINLSAANGRLKPGLQLVVDRCIEQTKPLDNTQKFFDDPAELYEGVMIILKPHSEGEKGVLLIKYSYYFPLLFKLFDVVKIQERYTIVLEPSWSGYCEDSILAYTFSADPVLVLTPEKRDFEFLARLNSNLVPVDLGASK
jgi:hypothetical protein